MWCKIMNNRSNAGVYIVIGVKASFKTALLGVCIIGARSEFYQGRFDKRINVYFAMIFTVVIPKAGVSKYLDNMVKSPPSVKSH